LPFQRIAITARSDFSAKEATLDRLVRVLESLGCDVSIDPARCDVPLLHRCRRFKGLENIDLVIIVGGDGTVLRTARELKDLRIPLLTVNHGTVGFLAELGTNEIEQELPETLHSGTLEERQLLSCLVLHEGETVLEGQVLNEIVISQGAIARLIELRTTVSGQPLTVFRADGVIIATPTGSTAYSLAAGGPIVHPKIAAAILTPINAHAFSQKPLVIPADEEVDVEVLPRESKFEHIDVSLTLDGQVHHSLHRGDHVHVKAHPECLKFLRRRRDTFYETLRGKLGWGE
jgi:NAD+ kinase